MTPDPRDGKKHPAIIWITGGDCNSIGDVWSEASKDNDQTASAYRDAGIVMMFPSLRGGNMNPGFQEGFYGEVDDIVAAADHLAAQPYIDPSRIYLGGHSTGGTMVLLVAEVSTRFRAVISLGPVSNISRYDSSTISLPFEKNEQEIKLRSPGFWLDSIKTPTYVFEGSQAPGNSAELRQMAKSTKSTLINFLLIKGTHFSLLSQVNKILAEKIIADNAKEVNLAFTDSELKALSALKPPVEETLRAMPVSTAIAGKKGVTRAMFVISKSDHMTGLIYSIAPTGGFASIKSVSMRQRTQLPDTESKVEAARNGYILFGVMVDADTKLNALQLVYVRLKDDGSIDPNDTYSSEWLGTRTKAQPVKLGCDQTKKVVGAKLEIQDGTISGIALSMMPQGST
ncbi:MAG: prolyl oligopeptidase family serine peptidase [Burkholderiales bacterium]|nr:prolyl oligopeptidase family serine peptidase [Phycisphaerae bacterium]